MIIGIDARKYFDYGIGTYIQNLIGEYVRKASHELVLFASRNDAATLKAKHNAKVVINDSAKYSFNELLSLSRQSERENIDLFHSPHYTLPFRLKAKRVVTVHDLIHMSFPNYYNIPQRTYARWMIRHACAAADAVLVDSEFVKSDIQRFFSVPDSKIHVIHLGVESLFFEQRGERDIEAFKSRHAIESPMVLYVGGLKPHKNIPRLLEAVALLQEREQLQLGLVGESMASYPHLQVMANELGIGRRLVHFGRLTKDELMLAYKSAAIVVLPSLYEGFGLTALEAMACGTPVVASNATSLPEVVGDAGRLVDPMDATGLAVALREVITEKTLRAKMVKKGRANARRFTWENCATKTITVYQHLLGLK